MLITSQDTFTDYPIEKTFGIVMGNTVRARHIGSDILASVRNVVGGESGSYTKLMTEAREEALERIQQAAIQKGANAIVCLRFTTTHAMQGMIEILAYGTAVRIKA